MICIDVFISRALHRFVESNQELWQYPGLFRGFEEGPLANSLIRCNPFLELEVSFGGEQCLVGTLSPLLVSDLGVFCLLACLFVWLFFLLIWFPPFFSF